MTSPLSVAISNQLLTAYFGRGTSTTFRDGVADQIAAAGNNALSVVESLFRNAVLDGAFAAGASPDAIAAQTFRNIFGREADSFEVNAWGNTVRNGAVSAEALPWQMFVGYLGATNVPVATHQLPAQSRIVAVDAFTNALGTRGDPGATVASDAREWLRPIQNQTDAAARVAGAVNAVIDIIAGKDVALPIRRDAPDIKIDVPIVRTDFKEANFDSGNIVPQTIPGTDLINLRAFRQDPRFSGIDGSGMTVVVLDTGIDLDHSAFGVDANRNGIADRIVFSRDFTTDNDGTVNDVDGHGTHVASIIASSNALYPGVAPGVNLISLQVLPNSGSGSTQQIENALAWIVENARTYNIVAVNMSVGDSRNFNSFTNVYGLTDEFQALAAARIVTVAAAGNFYRDFRAPGVSGIATDPSVLAVGAVWDRSLGRQGGNFDTAPDQIIDFSQRSPVFPTIFAPGGAILAAYPNERTGVLSGTSMAAPFVTGVAVLAQQLAERNLGRRLSVQELESLIVATGRQIVDSEETQRDNVPNTGATYARLDVTALAEAILARAGNLPSPVPSPVPPPVSNLPINTREVANDVSSTSTIQIGATIFSTIGYPYDRDYYGVLLNAGERYNFGMRGGGEAGRVRALSDPYLVLRSEDGTVILYNDDEPGGTTLDSRIDFVAARTGRYFLEARAYAGETGSYALSAQRVGAAQDIPGDTSTTASLAVGPGNAQAELRSEIGFIWDRDWIRVSLVSGATYQINVGGQGSNAGTLARPDFALRGSGGEFHAGGVIEPGSSDMSLLFTALNSGVYYIDVGARTGPSVGGPPFPGTGTYSLRVQEVARAAADTPGDASTTRAITVGQSLQDVIDFRGDQDWFRFAASVGAEYRIDLRQSGASPLSDPYLRVVNASGQMLAFDDDSGGALNSRLTFSSQSTQTLFISAEAFNGLGTGSYTLTVSQTRAPLTQDIPGDSSTRVSIVAGQTIESALDFTGDRDWFNFNVDANVVYQIDLSGFGNPSGLSDPYLRLFDSRGQQIAFDDDGGGGLNSRLIYSALRTETLFLAAAAYQDAGTGSYRLSVLQNSDIPGNTTTTNEIRVGQALRSVISSGGDQDWFRFVVSPNTRYQIDLVGVGEPALQDPYLRLLDSTGRLIAFDDDSGGNLNARIFYPAQSSGVLYISAESFVGRNPGTYSLSVTLV